MPRPYNALRQKMKESGVTVEALAREFHMTRQTLSNKMRNVTAWTLDECWAVMDALKIEPEMFYRYFPLKGRNE